MYINQIPYSYALSTTACINVYVSIYITCIRLLCLFKADMIIMIQRKAHELICFIIVYINTIHDLVHKHSTAI